MDRRTARRGASSAGVPAEPVGAAG
jgi:hypothetical protein